ncbi:MAG TPA: hypothetical protein VL402_07305 [Xanthobacteraceae bacterium]|jgi:hypothetical protein|nr:hypothetical protein [Xanthobacteraceae bacterium]
MASDKNGDHVREEPRSPAEKTPTICRIFTNGCAEFDGDYTDDFSDCLRAAFRARVIEQGLNIQELNISASSRTSCHATRSGPMTGIAQSQTASKTATIIAFRRST